MLNLKNYFMYLDYAIFKVIWTIAKEKKSEKTII